MKRIVSCFDLETCSKVIEDGAIGQIRLSDDNGAIFDDLGARFKVKSGDDVFHAVKSYPPFSACGRQQLCSACVSVMTGTVFFKQKTNLCNAKLGRFRG